MFYEEIEKMILAQLTLHPNACCVLVHSNVS